MLVSSVMCCALSLMTCCNQAQGFDLPGLAPAVYCEEGKTTETCKINNQIEWSSRWDYMYVLESMPHTNIQWFSLLNILYEPMRYPDRYLPNHFTPNQSLVY